MSEEKKSVKNLQSIFVPVLVVLAIGLSFFSGTLWQKVKNLEKGTDTPTQEGQAKPGIGNDKEQSDKLADFLKSAIDPKFLKKCLDSGKYDARLISDQQLATELGGQGTPGFFINNVFYPGAFSWDGNLRDPKDQTKEIPNSSMKSVVAGAKPASSSIVTLPIIKGLFDKDLIKLGDGDREFLFVEISDPSCPFCHIAGGKNDTLVKSWDKTGKYVPPVPEMKKLVDQGKASYVLIYSPGHGAGEMGMKALYCAFEAGKFWEVNDLLMSNEGYILMNGS